MLSPVTICHMCCTHLDKLRFISCNFLFFPFVFRVCVCVCVFCFSHSGLFFLNRFLLCVHFCARMRQSWFVCMYLATCGCRWAVSYLQCACAPFHCDFNLSVCVYIHGCPLHAQSLNRAVFVMSHENSHIVEQSEQKALGLSSEQRVMTHCVTCTCLCVLWGFFGWVSFFRLVTSVL